MLTQDRLKELMRYDEETGILTRRVSTSSNARAGDIAGSKDKDGYLVIRIDKKLYRAHRLAFLYVYGRFPEEFTDHINGIRDDNRISNLREVTRQENMQNQKKRTRPDMSMPTGVVVNKHKGIPNACRAYWHDISWKLRGSPSFNFKKCWGQELALAQAISYREARIAELVEQGAGYTERHWV